MKRYFWILLCIPIALYALFLFLYTAMLNNMSQAANDEYANIVSNYCADAATIELLDTADLAMDYATTGAMTVDPELAVHEYGANLCIALGYQPTEQMIQRVLRDHVKVLYVCGYDGYYAYQVELSGDERERNLQGTFKLPYTYEKDGSLYALTLGGGKCWKLTPGSGSSSTTLKRQQDCGLDKDRANHVINTRISDDMNMRITKLYEEYGNGWSNRVYIPASLTSLSSVNPITSPTVLAFVDGIEGSTAFGIGGTKLDDTRKVSGYVAADGTKYYCYSDLLPSSIIPTDMFDSIDDAARAGYHFDPVYMR